MLGLEHRAPLPQMQPCKMWLDSIASAHYTALSFSQEHRVQKHRSSIGCDYSVNFLVLLRVFEGCSKVSLVY